jgi:redox-sensitive bicupin YhaK (pirin superfamily)
MKTLKNAQVIHRKSNERGQTNISWLRSYHSFSFGEYYNRNAMGFGQLVVINDDIIAPGGGFPTHGHRDMEIITYVVSGTIAHEDSLGNRSFIQKGEFQRMTAGKGILHSEFNPSHTEPTRILQIWIRPSQSCLSPSYEQVPVDQPKGKITLLVSPDKDDKALTINQDAKIYYASFNQEHHADFELNKNKKYWLQMVNGEVTVNNDVKLEQGDGLGITPLEKDQLHFSSDNQGDFLLFEMAN